MTMLLILLKEMVLNKLQPTTQEKLLVHQLMQPILQLQQILTNSNHGKTEEMVLLSIE
jgi:hypothetical protein